MIICRFLVSLPWSPSSSAVRRAGIRATPLAVCPSFRRWLCKTDPRIRNQRAKSFAQVRHIGERRLARHCSQGGRNVPIPALSRRALTVGRPAASAGADFPEDSSQTNGFKPIARTTAAGGFVPYQFAFKQNRSRLRAERKFRSENPAFDIAFSDLHEVRMEPQVPFSEINIFTISDLRGRNGNSGCRLRFAPALPATRKQQTETSLRRFRGLPGF